MNAGICINSPPFLPPRKTGKISKEKREVNVSKIIVYALEDSDSLLNSFSRLQNDF